MGMRQLNVNMKVTVRRQDLLERLRSNRAVHATIVEEAERGYRKEATIKALQFMHAIEDGKIESFNKYAIHTPVSYLSAYDTVIQMLEWCQDDVVELTADEFRQFVEDQWDWKDGFITSNAAYSSSL
jgi:hypothetical protein